jgi:poly(A) polymerase
VITQIVESVQNLFGTRRIRKKPRVVTKEEHGIDRTLVSPFAISVCQKLTQAGFKAFIVGGAVRDLLIGHTPKDFDVVTDATPEQVRRLTRRAIIIGRRFRLVHVIRGAEVIEVSTFRGLGQ